MSSVFAQMGAVLTANASKSTKREQCTFAAHSRPPLPARAVPPGSRLMDGHRKRIAQRYAAHMVERRAAGYVRPRRGFISNLAYEFNCSVETVKRLTSRKTGPLGRQRKEN